ncbi:hypothetical protein I7X30_11735 [Capnocytophaga sp. 051621]|jgi:hypothetical protein|uniref:N-acetyltransferase n=2 Tax=Capnocytophaga TaxID=1016 RepID=A0ABS1YYG2_9FLAO|nr:MULTISPECIES: hypothetical protein [Capnocytophaga]MBI1647720.1 hypothetical protein [Capnocytophaga periodontitidis]MBM0651454.1 hypothetical protein [Capnocytophaga genosp. AHN8471]MBM0662942.1 hypothetical protein [Capnocytophaga genosp. AHN8471]
MYDIRYARKEDLPLIIEFLDNHWRKNHALVVSRKLMDFQHLNPITGDYNFIIAQNKQTGKIDALKGFIPTYQYDKRLYQQENDTWAAIWKVRKDIKNDELNNLAVYLWEMYFNLPNSKSFASIGLSNDAIKVHKATKNLVDIVKQYYILNNSVKNFKIAKIEHNEKLNKKDNASIEKSTIKDNFDIEPLTEESIQVGEYRPKKSVEYLKNRYLYHPIYKYKFWGVFVEDKLKAIWVIRIVKVETAKALRIVDMYGDGVETISCLYNEIQNLLSKYEAEYIDCLNYGFAEEVFETMGFTKLNTSTNEVIIPDYFEPFEQQNISLYFTYKLKDKNDRYVIFKGDSDQDRPNIIQ